MLILEEGLCGMWPSRPHLGDFENVSTLVKLCAKRTEYETSPSANIRCPSSTIGHMLVNFKEIIGKYMRDTLNAVEGGGRNKDLHDESYHLTSSMARLDLDLE
jgi:hypothetical protein